MKLFIAKGCVTMKKVALILSLLFIMLSSASCKPASEMDTIAERSADKSSMFIVVESGPYWYIVYNKYTKVMYAVSDSNYKGSGIFTVLVNADGSPMLYNEK